MKSSPRAPRPALRRGALGATVASVALLLAACGSEDTPAAAGADTPAPAGAINVVATTNVYGAVVKAIGGDAVAVTSILDSPSADPHSYEATPEVALEISDAKLLVMNGGGYDDFATTLVESAKTKPLVLNAVDISGLDADGDHAESGTATDAPTGTPTADEHSDDDGHDHGSFNEHVFYDIDSMMKVGDRIAAELGTLDPAAAGTFTTNAKTFTAALTELKGKAAAIGAAHPGAAAIATEPVIGYLFQDAGITNVTPEAFSEAVENETDPSVANVADVTDLLKGGTVALLAQNTQTSGPVIDQVVAAAESAGVPVIGVTETLPEGVTDYVTWIGNTLDTLSAALDK
ncbi:ABC transporter substrate-binding protein [Nakamurella silvestris]|nr:ABC transporter substrate-binding protein [Nakamurella silvestris]